MKDVHLHVLRQKTERVNVCQDTVMRDTVSLNLTLVDVQMLISISINFYAVLYLYSISL